MKEPVTLANKPASIISCPELYAFCEIRGKFRCNGGHSKICDVGLGEDKQESFHEEVYLYYSTFNIEYDLFLYSHIF